MTKVKRLQLTHSSMANMFTYDHGVIKVICFLLWTQPINTTTILHGPSVECCLVLQSSRLHGEFALEMRLFHFRLSMNFVQTILSCYLYLKWRHSCPFISNRDPSDKSVCSISGRLRISIELQSTTLLFDSKTSSLFLSNIVIWKPIVIAIIKTNFFPSIYVSVGDKPNSSPKVTENKWLDDKNSDADCSLEI